MNEISNYCRLLSSNKLDFGIALAEIAIGLFNVSISTMFSLATVSFKYEFFCRRIRAK